MTFYELAACDAAGRLVEINTIKKTDSILISSRDNYPSMKTIFKGLETFVVP